MSNPVYFKGGKPVDMVKNSNRETIYARNFVRNSVFDGPSEWRENTGGSATFEKNNLQLNSGIYQQNVLTQNLINLGVEAVIRAKTSSGTQSKIRVRYGGANANSYSDLTNDYAEYIFPIEAIGNGNLHIDTISSANVSWIKLQMTSGNKDWTPRPEDLTGTTATTAGGGEFS